MEKVEPYSEDPRDVLAAKLIEVGIDAEDADCIALDAGMGGVDEEYLMRHGIKGRQLEIAESLITDFHLGRIDAPKPPITAGYDTGSVKNDGDSNGTMKDFAKAISIRIADEWNGANDFPEDASLGVNE